MKGYVVRGTDHEGERCAAFVWKDGHDEMDAISSDQHTVFTEFSAADRARGMMWVRCCSDVRILSVAEDGTETVLPSYEDALAAIGRLTARIESMLSNPEEAEEDARAATATVDTAANRAFWRTSNTHKGTEAERMEAAMEAQRDVYRKARRAMIEAWARGDDEQKGREK